MTLNRRHVILTGAAALAATALPMAAISGDLPVAEMLFSPDEPWGAFVRGHVPDETFARSVLRLLDSDSDMRDNGEDWLFEDKTDADGVLIERSIAAPTHTYMRLGDPIPDFDETYYPCKATDPGAIAITAVMY